MWIGLLKSNFERMPVFSVKFFFTSNINTGSHFLFYFLNQGSQGIHKPLAGEHWSRNTFFLSFCRLILYPSRGPYCVSYSLFLHLGLFLQSSLLLRHRLSLVADIVSIGCRVGFVVLHSRVFCKYRRANLFWLCPFNSEVVLFRQQYFRLKVVCVSTYFEVFVSKHLCKIHQKT